MMRVLPMGPLAVLVEDPPGGPAAWSAGLRAAAPAVVDVVPAARTVLVRCPDEAARQALEAVLPDVDPVRADRIGGDVRLDVRYDGPDLDSVARACGLTAAEVVELHSGATYEVAFCGFAPGFGYLTGLPEQLHVPRRATPRTSVPSGSVAIAAGYTAVYPRSSPGGWHLLGRTDAVLFDPDREPPAVLAPGTIVTFRPVGTVPC